MSDTKDFDGAIRHYQKALEEDPKFVLAHNTLGMAIRHKEGPDSAIPHYQKALELDPNYVHAHLNLGLVLLGKNDFDGAIRHLCKVIDLDSENGKAHYNLGVALHGKKHPDGAIRHFQKAIEADPKYAIAHNNLAIVLSHKKDLDGAIRHYQKAIEADPKFVSPHNNLGLLLRDKGDVDGAIRHLQKALELNPAIASAHNNLRRLLRIKQVPAVLKGELQPASPEEWLRYVDVSLNENTDTSAFQLWNQFLLKHRTLAENKQLQEKPEMLIAMADVLQAWQKRPDLAGVRDEQNLAKLPEEERKSWQNLWAEAEQLRQQALGRFKERAQHSGTVTAKQHESIHEVKLNAGTRYVIHLESTAFDTFLVLMDAKGKKLADNDDIEDGRITNSRLFFTPAESGTYRLAASAFSGAGPYTLTIREFLK